MHENKSFNRNPANHALYHALMEALIKDENAIDKGVADTVKNHKRQHDDDDDDPSAGPNQGKKTKRRRTNESESSKKPSTAKETSKGSINHMMDIDHLTQEILVEPTYNLLKGTCTSSIELEYNMEECFKALTYRLDWNNPEGDRCPFDLTKPLPLKGRPGHLSVAAEYYFNNDLEFLKSSDPKKKYTTSIMKTKAARYEIVRIEYMNPLLWSTIKHGYDKDAEKGIKHWGERRKIWYRSQCQETAWIWSLGRDYGERAYQQLYKFKEGNFVDLHLNDIEDMLLLDVQHKLFHLNDSDILGVESYQKKLNITAPHKTFPEIEFKELYTP
ncbi:hypothetical protein Tco_0455861 [Tanacetum coccineum]